LGPIQCFKIEDGLSYFDFAQVSGARALVELLRSGITLSRLRRSMQELQAWLGSANQPSVQLVAIPTVQNSAGSPLIFLAHLRV
jgi:hypothetical protein